MSLFRAALIVFGVLVAIVVLAAIFVPSSPDLVAPTASNAAVATATDDQPMKDIAATSPQPPLDLSKPLFTRANAIICPLDTFLSPLASNSRDKLEAMFDNQGDDRDVTADIHGCEMWQGHIDVSLIHVPHDPHNDIYETIRELNGYDFPDHNPQIVALVNDPRYVLLADYSGSGSVKVTRADELTN